MTVLVGPVVSGEPEALEGVARVGRDEAAALRRLAAKLEGRLADVASGTRGRRCLPHDAPLRLRRLADVAEAADHAAGAVGGRLRLADRPSVEELDRQHRAAIVAWLDAAMARPYGTDDPLVAARILGLRRLVEERPEARILAFDPHHGPDGEPVLTVLIGEPATSAGVAVLVPGTTHGAHTVIDDLDTAQAIRAAAAGLGQEVAVVVDVWDAPDQIVRDARRAVYGEAHVPDLVSTVAHVRDLAPDVPVTLVGHSYGSFAVGRAAAAGAAPDRIVLVGTPGVGEHRAASLGIDPSQVFVARAPRDEIEIAADADEWLLGGIAPASFALGPDPADVDFGARVFAVNPVDLDPDDPTYVQGHSAYFTPGSQSLANIARIVAGAEPTVPDPALLQRVPVGTTIDQLEWRHGSDGSRAVNYRPWSGGSW